MVYFTTLYIKCILKPNRKHIFVGAIGKPMTETTREQSDKSAAIED